RSLYTVPSIRIDDTRKLREVHEGLISSSRQLVTPTPPASPRRPLIRRAASSPYEAHFCAVCHIGSWYAQADSRTGSPSNLTREQTLKQTIVHSPGRDFVLRPAARRIQCGRKITMSTLLALCGLAQLRDIHRNQPRLIFGES